MPVAPASASTFYAPGWGPNNPSYKVYITDPQRVATGTCTPFYEFKLVKNYKTSQTTQHYRKVYCFFGTENSQ